MKLTRFLGFALALASAFATDPVMAADAKRERIDSTSLYFPTAEKAEAVKKLWSASIRSAVAFVVGSPDEHDYVEPKVTRAVRPKGQHRKGTVTAMAIVNRYGEVIATQVVDSTDRGLELPALQALQQWRFEPGRYKGVTVSWVVAVPLEFAP